MRLKIPEVPNPPPYSNLSSPTSTPTHDRKFVEIPLHEHAPYPVDSCRNLGKAENAIPDEDEFNANLGVLHRNDFEKTKRYEGKTMVQIQEVGSRKYRVDDPPLHSDHALYTVYVLEQDIPCYLPTGDIIELEGSQIKATRTSKNSLKEHLEVHDRAFVFIDIPDGGPVKNTPIVICQAGLSISSNLKLFGKFTYKVRVLEPGFHDMKYIIDRDLVHDELQPLTLSQALTFSTVKVGFFTRLLCAIGLRRKPRSRG